MVFEDTDSLRLLLERLKPLGVKELVVGPLLLAEVHQFDASDPGAAAEAAAEHGRVERRELQITGACSTPLANGMFGVNPWVVTFTPKETTIQAVASGPDDWSGERAERETRAIADVVDMYTRPVRWVRRRRPVLDPGRMIAALQREHDRKMAWFAAMWGFLGGLLPGVVALLLD
ncbi:hypothetical protein [Cellulomonas sp. HD19AZ1]|uniref:hypothetical protein n=1 Tax=Cellulomonas sp. HD19AZ1 TaxID=2559593 RepID=UPI0010709EA2|nr:hypothetical protein [Cellulomonas sp. HD19AZ1]TFH70618.1 hypothetical protein E4A51_12735 [Cellulomonas sp. HD19AZ1]